MPSKRLGIPNMAASANFSTIFPMILINMIPAINTMAKARKPYHLLWAASPFQR